jgi:hypothetical protein
MAYQTTIADDETVSVDEQTDDGIKCACDYGSPGCYEHYEVADNE